MKYLLTIVLILLLFPVMAQRHDWTIVGRDFVTNNGYLVDSFSSGQLYPLAVDVVPFGSDTSFAVLVYSEMSPFNNCKLAGILPVGLNGNIKPVVRSFEIDSVRVVPLRTSINLRASFIWNKDSDSTFYTIKPYIAFIQGAAQYTLKWQRKLIRDHAIIESADILTSGNIRDAFRYNNSLYMSTTLDTSVGSRLIDSNILFWRHQINPVGSVYYNMSLNSVNNQLDSNRLYHENTLLPSVDRSSIIHSYRYALNSDTLYLFETDYNYLHTGRVSKVFSKFKLTDSYFSNLGLRRSGNRQNIPLTHFFEQRYLLGRTLRYSPDSSAISILDKYLRIKKNILIPGSIVYVKPLQNRNIFVSYSITTRQPAASRIFPDSLFYISVFDTLGNELFRHEIYEANIYSTPAKRGLANYPLSYTEDHKGGLFILCYARTGTLVHLSNIGKFYHDTVRTGPVVSLASQIPSGTFKYYPNPADNTLTITSRASDDAPQSALVIDMLGRKVAEYSVRGERATIDISQIPQGVYKVKVGAEVQTLVIKR